MPMTPDDRRRAVQQMARWLFERPNETATVDKAALEAAADDIYDTLQSLAPQIAGAMPEPFKTQTTAAQKKRAVAVIAAIDGGVGDFH